MRILFTGGGTGGHFYPIIAVAKELDKIVKEKKLLAPELYYMSPTPYNEGLLYETGITYKKNSAGKLRRYFSIKNFFDFFKTGWGIFTSILMLWKIYPDVVFGKGGYGSFPALMAARILRIPVVIHESDTSPGIVNKWAGKFAERIAISYPEAAKYFPADKAVLTGNPVREDIVVPITEGAKEFLNLKDNIPVVLILGGSQGAANINDIILEGLPELVKNFYIIHQTGKENFIECKSTSEAVLFNSEFKDRYKPFDYLNPLAMRMSAGVASIVVSRAGSTIFEIAAWGLPSIIIPIPEATSHDQRTNAFSYEREGACIVIEEHNLTPHLLLSELNRLMSLPEEREKMSKSAKAFYKADAAHEIAEEILKIALTHEVER
jgi:UDP-N-acetylglucosamine--N-acetylmuramyl-(pentapeptide) pyrophosphoryl-undecaprenol N-acetylglucosamine transferase